MQPRALPAASPRYELDLSRSQLDPIDRNLVKGAEDPDVEVHGTAGSLRFRQVPPEVERAPAIAALGHGLLGLVVYAEQRVAAGFSQPAARKG